MTQTVSQSQTIRDCLKDWQRSDYSVTTESLHWGRGKMPKPTYLLKKNTIVD